MGNDICIIVVGKMVHGVFSGKWCVCVYGERYLCVLWGIVVCMM